MDYNSKYYAKIWNYIPNITHFIWKIICNDVYLLPELISINSDR